jgi:hypothetical protein
MRNHNHMNLLNA